MDSDPLDTVDPGNNSIVLRNESRLYLWVYDERRIVRQRQCENQEIQFHLERGSAIIREATYHHMEMDFH